jgi:hypothetical protein
MAEMPESFWEFHEIVWDIACASKQYLFLSLSLMLRPTGSLSWNKAPIWGLRPDFCYCQTVVGLSMCGTLPDERTGPSFTIDACPCECSNSMVQVPWDSWSYFTVSDVRLIFLSPPTTCRVTVEVFDPASTWDSDHLFLHTYPGFNIAIWCLKVRILESEKHYKGIHCYATAC